MVKSDKTVSKAWLYQGKRFVKTTQVYDTRHKFHAHAASPNNIKRARYIRSEKKQAEDEDMYFRK